MSEIDIARIDLNLLRALDVLLTRRSVTLAARDLGVGQSAMSHSLRKLRELFDDPLLVRTGQGMEPTDRAARMQRPLRDVLGDLARVVALDKSFDPATSRRGFRVATPDYVQAIVLPPVLDVVMQEAPALQLDFRAMSRSGAMNALLEGSVDLALGLPPEPHPALRRRALLSDDFVCIAGRRVRLRQSTLDLEAYCDHRHVVVAPDQQGPSPIDHALAKKNRSRQVAVRLTDFLIAPMVVKDTNMLLTVPRRLSEVVARQLKLRVYELPFRSPKFQLTAMWHERQHRDIAHQWLRRHVAAACDR